MGMGAPVASPKYSGFGPGFNSDSGAASQMSSGYGGMRARARVEFDVGVWAMGVMLWLMTVWM